MSVKDPYQALGVSRKSTADEIKNAYRKLAKKFHPDLNPGNKEAEQKFKDAAAAYEILGDTANRAKYDRGEWGAPEGGAGPGAGAYGGGPYYQQARPGAGGRYDFQFDGFEDMFADLFRRQAQTQGGGSRRGEEGGRGRGAFEGEEETYRMEVDYQDAVSGAETEIALPHGKRLHVKIPAGVAEGTKLRFPKQGSDGKSDLYVEIQFREDPRFLREGADLFVEVPVSFVDAAVGGEVKVPTPEGQVLLKVPARTNGGKKFRVPGKGLRLRGRKERGDLTAVVRLVMPEQMDESLEQALRHWKESQRSGERSAV